MRALVKQQYGIKSMGPVSGLKSWNDAESAASLIQAVNPLFDSLPVVVENIVPVKSNNEWILKDENGNGVFIKHNFRNPWKLMALSGGKPVKIFAVGKEHLFEPMGVWVNDHYILLV